MTAFSHPLATPGQPLSRPRTIVYIDGFNLYYGALKHTNYKWLNLDKYFQLIRPHDEICLIRYFTAKVHGKPEQRQSAYLQALATTPIVNIILGRFKDKNVRCCVAECSHASDRFFSVPEEKRTDVNLAVYMLDDAYQNQCDNLILVSGDSDLVPAVRMIRTRFPTKRITVYVPSNDPVRSYAVELRNAAHKDKNLPLNLLQRAQFEAQLPDGSGGTIIKPDQW